MFSFRYLVLAAAAISAATAMPSTSTPRSVDINDMTNNTVCAIDVTINEDENRIPSRIKMIKCKKETNQWCLKNNISPHDCCHHTNNQHVMECVVMTDTVLVLDKVSNTTKPFNVAVGCACMIGRSMAVPSVEKPDTQQLKTS